MNRLLRICVVLSLCLLSNNLIAQQKEPSGREVQALQGFVSAGYMRTPLGDVDRVFSIIERNYRTAQGKEFKTLYYFSTGLRYELQPGHIVRGELFGTVWKEIEDQSSNYLSSFDLAATYLYELSVPFVNVYGGAGFGYVWLNAQRTYSTHRGVATVETQLAEVHGVVGAVYRLHQNATVGIEGRYMIAETITPESRDHDIGFRGFTAGAVISFGIF